MNWTEMMLIFIAVVPYVIIFYILVKKDKLANSVQTFILIASLIIIFFFVYIAITYQSEDKFVDGIGIYTFAFSLIAILISLYTFITIDSVNTITKMEGNVLENENYSVSLTNLLSHYNAKDSNDLKNEIIKDLNNKFNNSDTALEFTYSLQYFIDILVFLPSLKEKDFIDINKIIKKIRSMSEKFTKINTGNRFLIDECINLIEGIINYQEKSSKKDQSVDSSLLSIRGKSLKNPVTQTVYYDYLGLSYYKKGVTILENNNLIDKNIYSLSSLSKLLNNYKELDEEDKELVVIYLEEANICFKKAIQSSKDEVMWEGFIKYNIARVSFLLEVFTNNNYNWLDAMNEAITARFKFKMLIDDIFDKTHLNNHFLYQEYLARLVKYNMLIALGEDININGSIYKYPKYKGLEHNKHIKKDLFWSKLLTEYQNDIIDVIMKGWLVS